MRYLIVILTLLFVGAPAFADRVSEARQMFQEANAHFAVGEFAEAAEKFQEAYKLRPDAALLYNAAQSLRLSGNNNQKALVLYKNYLRFYPNEKNFEEVRGQIEKLQAAVAASEQAKSAPPTSTADHSQPLPAMLEAAPARPAGVAPEAASVVVATGARPTPGYKKWWVWTIVGAIVAGAVVTGVVVGTSSSGKWATTADVGPGAHAAALVRW
jgi:tetratricopeptide (TPR) repeat protein